MTKTEIFEKGLAEMSNEEVISKSRSAVSKLAETYGRSFQMSIPPHKHDTDILLMELIDRYARVTEKW